MGIEVKTANSFNLFQQNTITTFLTVKIVYAKIKLKVRPKSPKYNIHHTYKQFFCTFFLHLFKQILPLTLSAFYPLTQLFMHLDIFPPPPPSSSYFFFFCFFYFVKCVFSLFFLILFHRVTK